MHSTHPSVGIVLHESHMLLMRTRENSKRKAAILDLPFVVHHLSLLATPSVYHLTLATPRARDLAGGEWGLADSRLTALTRLHQVAQALHPHRVFIAHFFTEAYMTSLPHLHALWLTSSDLASAWT
jgi:hypothetical protein